METIIFFTPLIARFLIGFYFVLLGFHNIFYWAPIIKTMLERNIFHPYLVLSISILIQVILGFFIIFGIYSKIAAALLIIFTIIAVIIFHPFWKFHGETRNLNFVIFFSNLTATISALIFLMLR